LNAGLRPTQAGYIELLAITDLSDVRKKQTRPDNHLVFGQWVRLAAASPRRAAVSRLVPDLPFHLPASSNLLGNGGFAALKQVDSDLFSVQPFFARLPPRQRVLPLFLLSAAACNLSSSYSSVYDN